MRFVDAHTHLSDSEYNGKVDEIIERQVINVVTMVPYSMNLEMSRRVYDRLKNILV